tara:strand:- start:454 stop:759 length:306 start_codon:yes stop_codon:yes gene_type:complete
MAQTIAGIQLEAITKGPLLARMFPDITNKCVYFIVQNWEYITSSAGEQKWAAKQITEEVQKAFSIIYIFMIKIMVTLLIKWFNSKRNSKFDSEMEQIQPYL